MYLTFLSVSLKAFYNREMDNDTTFPEKQQDSTVFQI